MYNELKKDMTLLFQLVGLIFTVYYSLASVFIGNYVNAMLAGIVFILLFAGSVSTYYDTRPSE